MLAPRAMIPPTIAAAFDVLRAYEARDVARLAALTVSTKRAGLARLTPDDPAWAALFDPSGWRMRALSGWARPPGIRYGSGPTQSRTSGTVSYCRFFTDAADAIVLILVLEGGRWLVDDMRRMPAAEYEAFGELSS